MSRRRRIEFARTWGDQWGVKVATESVCEGHSAPGEFLAEWMFDRPSLSLVHGPRGGGKSFLRSLATHYDSLRHARHDTKILGGSLAQSQQIYQALGSFYGASPDSGVFRRLLKTEAEYATSSTVSMLAASPTSVRGPHVQSLNLDEVDEIDPAIREDSLGMCMELRGVRASISMTSTWHRVGGPMDALMERGWGGEFPVHTFCIFEVLEQCPEERSGPGLERCPECPLVQWCHSDRDRRPDGLPKAKRSNGHYAIDSLIQKVRLASLRVFESDYLCSGPKADGLWFRDFDESQHVTTAAEFDPDHPVHVAVDSGVHSGGVLYQVREVVGDRFAPPQIKVNVFGDLYAEGMAAGQAALEVKAIIERLCPDAIRRVSTDSAGGSRNPVGPTVLTEYLNAGLAGKDGLETWPKYAGCVQAGLGLVESLVKSADGGIHLTIHPRCKDLIAAFRGYSRAKVAGQWRDYPADPQHPYEELIDSLRASLLMLYPDGRKAEPKFAGYKPASRLF